MLPEKLQKKLDERREINSLRELKVADNLIDFSSNDYLGWGRSQKLNKRANRILADFGSPLNGATGSRLLTGNYSLYTETERDLAKFHKAESALIFNSGYDANVGLLGSVPQRGDVIFYDEFAHASIRDGIRLSMAKAFKFSHNNLENLEKVVSRNKTSRGANYIVTESVFSMDGDMPDLKAMAEFCTRKGYYLIVDEAHALGIMGPNGAGLAQFEDAELAVFARVVTFGKALGCHGAAVLGGGLLRSYLVNYARSFMYTTGLPPHSLATIKAAYEQLASGVNFESLNSNIAILQTGIIRHKLQDYFLPSRSTINSCVVPGNTVIKSISGKLQEQNYDVRPILSPTVPVGRERLRFCLHSFNTKTEIDGVLALLAKLITKLGR